MSDVLQLTRLLSASPREVFEAWTDPAFLQQWMCPVGAVVSEIEADVQVGGCFVLVMEGLGPVPMRHTGVYQVIEPYEKLAFTWISSATEGLETRVTITLQERGEQTELHLEQTKIPSPFSWQIHLGGWGSILEHLSLRIEESLS